MLHGAAANGMVPDAAATIRFWRKNGADPNLPNADGKTSFDVAYDDATRALLRE